MKLKRWHWIFGLALLGSLSFEFMGERTPPVEVWDNYLFFALMGLFGCIILSVIAKGIVSPALDRPEDFYGPDDAEGDWSTESPAARADVSDLRADESDGGVGEGDSRGHESDIRVNVNDSRTEEG